MASYREFRFVAPDGWVFVRRSKTRTYSHAILFKRNGKWHLGSCVGRPDLVAARLELWGKGSPDTIAVNPDHASDARASRLI